MLRCPRPDSFSILTPAANQELTLSAVPNTPVTAHWSEFSAPKVGETILFTSTRGMLSGGGTAITDMNGDATVMIGSTIAGLAQITAENSDGTTTAVAVEFVADTPATLTIQANPTTVAVNEQSEILVIVRDAQFNLVKNQVIDFLIVADDSFGQLSVGSAVTDSQGSATVFYTAGLVSGTPNGVTISATVRGTMVAGMVNLTVARKELDLVIGTGNDIFSPTSATHAQMARRVARVSVEATAGQRAIQKKHLARRWAESLRR